MKTKILGIYKVQMPHIINTAAFPSLNLEQHRLLAVYLAKKNQSDENTRVVSFSISAFEAFFDIKRVRADRLHNSIDGLLKAELVILEKQPKTVKLFNSIVLDETDGEKSITMDCSDEISKYLFGVTRDFVSCELDNIKQFENVQTIRLYELAKQCAFDRRSCITVSVATLKMMLGLAPNSYNKYTDFRACVIKPAIEAIRKYSDIEVEYIDGNRKKLKVDKITIKAKRKSMNDTQEAEETAARPMEIIDSIPSSMITEETQTPSQKDRTEICAAFEDSFFESFSYVECQTIFGVAQRRIISMSQNKEGEDGIMIKINDCIKDAVDFVRRQSRKGINIEKPPAYLYTAIEKGYYLSSAEENNTSESGFDVNFAFEVGVKHSNPTLSGEDVEELVKRY